MARELLDTHYRSDWEISRALDFAAFNCGYCLRPEDSFRQNQQNLVWRLLEGAPIDATTRLCDVGCGIGGPAGWVCERFEPRLVVGVEFSNLNVANAEALWADQPRRPRFVQGNAQSMPLATGSVDVVMNLESALHYPDKAAFLRECRRVLKPSGLLCLGDIVRTRVLPFNLLAKVTTGNVFLYSLGEYQRGLREAGFEIIRHENAASSVAQSIERGLSEWKARGIRATGDVAQRVSFLRMLGTLLRWGWLRYDLFAARPLA